jgi:type II secretory pathway component GspD/PulD (secretin)
MRSACHLAVAGLVWLLIPALGLLAAPQSEKPPESPADKIRKALDEPISIEFKEQSLGRVLAELSEKTKVKLVFDPALGPIGYDADELPITAKLQDVKLRSALRTMLTQQNLTFVPLKDKIVVTTEGERALYLQLRQQVSVDLEDVPLATALKRLSRDTHTCLVLDPRVAKEAKAAPITLQVDDVPLETAVRLVAEIASLKAVRVGSVVFVTTEARADKLRAEPDLLPANSKEAAYELVPEMRMIPRRKMPVPLAPPAAIPAPAPAPAPPQAGS